MIANTLRYFPTQLRDRLMTRGVAMAAVGALMMLQPILGDTGRRPAPPEQLLGNAIEGMLVFLVLIAAYGVIGEDVRRGFFRNVFSKPVSPTLYYLQELLTAGIAVALVVLLAVGAFAAFREPAWPGRALTQGIFVTVLLAAVIFGFSRVHGQLDWLVGVVLFVFGTFTRRAYPPAQSLKGAVLNVVLPPSHLFGGGGLYDDDGIALDAVLWIVGYAGLWVVLGVILIRVLAFGTQRS